MTPPAPSTRRLAPVLAAAALLSGCAVVQPDLVAEHQATSVTRSAAEAWARLPAEAGEVLSVVEEIRPAVRSQRIVLAGTGALPGENALTVSVPGPSGGRAARPTEASIAAEMEAALPGIPMRLAEAPGRNAHGPFAYATGRAGPFTCLYAWQRLEGGATGLLGTRASTVDVRVRLCREAEPAVLAGHVEAMALAVAARPYPASDPLVPPGADPLTVATGGGFPAY